MRDTTAVREVLILIFLENALRPIAPITVRFDQRQVLILIFLENALRRAPTGTGMECLSGLNPYFFGKCSTAFLRYVLPGEPVFVLILIFLENALRLVTEILIGVMFLCLNPYFFGKCSTA